MLISRLALRDLRRRRVEALLLLVALAATTTTLTMGLTAGGVTDRPWERTRAATAGPDVVVTSASTPVSGSGPVGARADTLTALAGSPGVTAMAGPYVMRYHDDLQAAEGRRSRGVDRAGALSLLRAGPHLGHEK